MCIVVYQGSKLFWRTRNTIDITIVDHRDSDVTEVIAYEPSIDVEAERIYLNSNILRTKLNHVEIDSNFSFAKQNNVPISTEFIDSVINHAITDFILARLIISEFSREERRFEVNLVFRDGDRAYSAGGNNTDELVCAKPAELQPYQAKNHKLLACGEVDAALKALQEEQRNLDITCTQAAVLESQASVPLTAKQRWRIPIVLVHLNKGKILDAEDTKIWDGVSRNFKTAEDIERVTQATVEQVTSPAQLAAEKATKKPIMNFRQVVEAIQPRYKQITLNRGVIGAGAGTAIHAWADSKAHEARMREKLEHSNGRHRPMETPVRSPLPTPRAISRASSSRLLAGTATSQARAQCAAEDNSPTPKTAHKKFVKRGSSRLAHGSSTSHNNSAHNSKNNSRNNSRSNSRQISHVNTRSHVSGPRHAGDASQENSAGPEVDLSECEWADSPGIAEITRESFVGMVAAQLSSFATAVSSKFKSPSERPSSVKMEGAVCEVNGDVGPMPVQTSPPDSTRVTGNKPSVGPASSLPRQLSGFISFLKGGKSSSHSLKSVQSDKHDKYGPEETIPISGNNATATAGSQCHPVITEGAPGREETMSARVPGGAVPGKRRSYFGILFASLVRANSGHAEAYVPAGANSGPFFTPQTELANRGDKIKPSGLTSWLPWSHTTASSATVVPVNLAEYTRAQFAE